MGKLKNHYLLELEEFGHESTSYGENSDLLDTYLENEEDDEDFESEDLEDEDEE